MIKIDNVEVMGWEPVIRGMRNPMNSWDKSDSFKCDGVGCYFEDCPAYKSDIEGCEKCGEYVVGPNDLDLMMRLAKGGSTHAKYRRMIVCFLDVLAPLYWWKEADTYKVGTVANSCSTMHKIHAKEFTLDDFSHEHLMSFKGGNVDNTPLIQYNLDYMSPMGILEATIKSLNLCRKMYLETHYKAYWWQMIQLLPSSYNQKRTVMLNYEVLSHMYHDRKDHKLDEWRDFCQMIKGLPYAQIITLEEE